MSHEQKDEQVEYGTQQIRLFDLDEQMYVDAEGAHVMCNEKDGFTAYRPLYGGQRRQAGTRIYLEGHEAKLEVGN